MILIVDDDRDLTSRIDNLLARNKYDAKIAHSVKEGLSIAEQYLNQIKLAFIDFNLTDGKGFDLIRSLKNNMNATFPCVLFSGFTKEAGTTILETDSTGLITGYIAKKMDDYPLTAQKVLDYIKTHISADDDEQWNGLFAFNISNFNFISSSIAFKEIKKSIDVAVTNNKSLLISGTKGTGKSHLIKTICNNLNSRYSIYDETHTEEQILTDLYGMDIRLLAFDELTDFSSNVQNRLANYLEKNSDDKMILGSITNQEEEIHNHTLENCVNSFPVFICLPRLSDRDDQDIIDITNQIITKLSPTIPINFNSESQNFIKQFARYGNIKDIERILKRVLILSQNLSRNLIVDEINKERSLFAKNNYSALQDIIVNFALQIIKLPRARLDMVNKFLTPLSEILDKIQFEITRQILLETEGNKIKCGKIIGYSSTQVGNILG